jgi:hypothetical protein
MSSRDPKSLRRDELSSILKGLTQREQRISKERRSLHVQIDSLRSELVKRLRDEGQTAISGSDLDEPDPTGAREPRKPRPGLDSDSIALPEPKPEEP